MYRYSVDKSIVYTAEDLLLYKESPFASWMERLTLENPDHGIPPDFGSEPPRPVFDPEEDIASLLAAEGRDVTLVHWEMEEPLRRSATLAAMRSGTDFIVNGQLAVGPLSGTASLLMRTSGYSELGAFLYLPCDTHDRPETHWALRLAFLADLLHSIQGQLPPQMLVIRHGTEVVPLQTEDHIYHYRAVKRRFMRAMRDFRKHRMPDPSESYHFGRWSDCAHEMIMQRELRGDIAHPEMVEEKAPPAFEGELAPPRPPLRQWVNTGRSSSVALSATVYDLDDESIAARASGTLAEQAKALRQELAQAAKVARRSSSPRRRPGSRQHPQRRPSPLRPRLPRRQRRRPCPHRRCWTATCRRSRWPLRQAPNCPGGRTGTRRQTTRPAPMTTKSRAERAESHSAAA
jgi:hypothetical protein